MVLVCHYAHFITEKQTISNFLWTGVDLFFVISGFVFAKLIFSSQININSFFIRRFFRIYPLYLVALVIYFFLTNNHTDKIYYFVKHLFFLHTTTSKEEAFFFNPAFWSLPVEVEFYIFIPVLVYISKFKNLLFGLLIFSLSIKFLFILNSNNNSINIYYIFGKAHLSGILSEFLIGVYLYRFVIFSKNSYSKSTLVKLNLISIFLGFLLILIIATGFVRFGGWFNIMCSLGYALLLLPLTYIEQNNSMTFINKIFIFVGSISYPVYLMHNASPKFLQIIGANFSGLKLFIICTIVTIILSVILHKCIEEPLRI